MKVAVVGASSNRAKFGNKALRCYAAAGHQVYAINPNESLVEGQNTYRKVSEVPEQVDRVLLYVPPQVGVQVLEDLAQCGVAEVYVNPGAGSPELMARGSELGLNLVQACAIVDIGDSPARY